MEHQIETIYLGDLRSRSTHLNSGQDLITDAPLDNNGKGEFFSPTDLFVTSLASCMLTIMGIAAKNQKIDIDDTYAVVKKVMSENPRKISEIHIKFTFKKYINEKYQKILERAASHCPVSKSIHPEIKEIIIFDFLEE